MGCYVMHYRAPKPTFSRWDRAKFIAIRVIFPPILLWDLIKIGFSKLLGEGIGELILPAQKMNFILAMDNPIDYGRLVCKHHIIETYDGARLDTFELDHQSQKALESKYQKYIINFVGNASCYERHIEEMKNDAEVLQANVVGFNFRGVYDSSGKAKSSEDLVTDGIAQVQRLLDQGVSPQNITLKGHSLGAGIAALVANHFHQLKQPINVFNSRSFSTISDVLVGHIRLERDEKGLPLGHKESLGKKILGWLATPFIKLALALVKWEIKAGAAFRRIPEAYRDYVVVRSKKSERDQRTDDPIIPHYASIHKALSSERHRKKSEIRKAIDEVARHPKQNKKALEQAREEIKNGRKMKTHEEKEDGHNVSLSLLHNQFGKSGQAVFTDFVCRATEDHAVRKGP